MTLSQLNSKMAVLDSTECLAFISDRSYYENHDARSKPVSKPSVITLMKKFDGVFVVCSIQWFTLFHSNSFALKRNAFSIIDDVQAVKISSFAEKKFSKFSIIYAPKNTPNMPSMLSQDLKETFEKYEEVYKKINELLGEGKNIDFKKFPYKTGVLKNPDYGYEFDVDFETITFNQDEVFKSEKGVHWSAVSSAYACKIFRQSNLNSSLCYRVSKSKKVKLAAEMKKASELRAEIIRIQKWNFDSFIQYSKK